MSKELDLTPPQFVDKEILVTELFKPNGLDVAINFIKSRVDELELDISTIEKRTEINSICRKIASSVNYIDDRGKELVIEEKRRLGLIDAERKRFRDYMEEYKQQIRKPLTQWEMREASRIKGHEDLISAMNNLLLFGGERNSEEIQLRLTRLDEIYENRNWEEYEVKATKSFKDIKYQLLDLLDTTIFNEEKELKEKEEIKIREEAIRIQREERIRQEAATQAKLAAEAQIKLKLTAIKEKTQIKLSAAKEVARIALEKMQQEAAEKLKQIQKEAEAKVEQEKKFKEAEEKRINNEKHRAKIKREIIEDLTNTYGTKSFYADFIHAIDGGKIRHLKILY